MNKQKKTILIDLDGVLNTYCGDFDENFIPPIKDGADKFLEKLSNNYNLKIFTTRNKLLTSKWLIQNNIDKFISDVTNTKESAWLITDDRCVNFSGNYNLTMNQISDFSVWYK